MALPAFLDRAEIDRKATEVREVAPSYVPTAVQRHILSRLAGGQSNKQIAKRMGLTIAQVEYQVHRLFSQTASTNRVQLALWWESRLASSHSEK